jgi:hypothetical protein
VDARSIDLDDSEALVPSRVGAHRDTLTFFQRSIDQLGDKPAQR